MKYIVIILILFETSQFKTQIKFENNFIVGKTDDEFKSSEKDSVISFLKDYHRFIIDNPKYVSQYWDSIVLKTNSMPDYMLKQELSRYKDYDFTFNLILLFKKDSIWIAQIGYNLSKDNEFKGLCCVYNFAILNRSGNIKLTPIIDTYTYNVVTDSITTLKCFPPLVARKSDFDSLSNFNNKLSKIFKVDKKRFNCYKFQNFSETNRRLGLDVQYFSVYKTENAYCDHYNNKIYASNTDVFLHELVHLYVNKCYPNCNRWFDEGFATFMGGSSGFSLNTHLRSLKEDLKKNDKYDLNNLFSYQNKKTNSNAIYLYVIGGLFCKIVYEKEGYEGVFKLLKVPNASSAEFYSAIEKHIGVKQENLNEFLRKELEKY
jgi:hypothetical protein